MISKAFLYLIGAIVLFTAIGLVFNYVNVWLSWGIGLAAIYCIIRAIEKFITGINNKP